LDRYPQLDRRRLLLWGGSQGAHIAAQCLVFAPSLWAGAVLCCGLYHPYTHVEATADFYHWDIAVYPGLGFVEYAFGRGATLPQRETQIRSPRRNARLMPDGVPIILIHGTHDDNVDIRHSVGLYARLLACGKLARFYAISNGDHGLAGAEADDENSRHNATLKYAADVLGLTQRPLPGVWPAHPTTIVVDGGRFEVHFGDEGPSLVWVEA
jgi:dipeptidyl aminopeptidase/acylaminoacyl peptidase